MSEVESKYLSEISQHRTTHSPVSLARYYEEEYVVAPTVEAFLFLGASSSATKEAASMHQVQVLVEESLRNRANERGYAFEPGGAEVVQPRFHMQNGSGPITAAASVLSLVKHSFQKSINAGSRLRN